MASFSVELRGAESSALSFLDGLVVTSSTDGVSSLTALCLSFFDFGALSSESALAVGASSSAALCLLFFAGFASSIVGVGGGRLVPRLPRARPSPRALALRASA